MEQISASHSFGDINNNLSSSVDSLQDKKDYIEFNISNFFKHYKVEDKIKKLSADCIILSQIRDTVENLLYLEIPELKPHNKTQSKHNDTKPKPYITTTTTTYKHVQPKSTRHHINNTNNNSNTTFKKTVSKSPTQKHHLTNRTPLSHMNTINKGKSLASFRAHSSARSDLSTHNSLTSSTISAWASSSKGLTGTNIKKPLNQKSLILHTRTKTSISTSSTSLSKVNKSTVINKNKLLSTTPDKKVHTKSTNTNNTLTPNKTRNYKHNNTLTHNKCNTTVDAIPTKNSKVSNRGNKRPNALKIGNFKDEDNRAISPIVIGSKTRKQNVNNNKKKTTNVKGNISVDISNNSNSTHKKDNTHSKKNHNIFNTIKTKEMNLNTSTEVVDNSALTCEKEITERTHNKEHTHTHTPSIHFNNPNIQAIYISITSGYLTPPLKAKTILSIPELYRSYPKKSLLKELLNYYETKLNNNNSLINKYDLRGIMIQFIPSKKAQNGLNFVTKEEEKYLLRKEQTSEITNLFILILILLNEPIPTITSSKDFLNNFFTDIYPKYNVITMKNLFMDCIVVKLPSLHITIIESFMNYIKSHPNILDRSIILSINQSISYMTFILNEIHSYLSMQTADGVYYYTIRAKYEENTYLNETISKLNTYISS